VSEQAKRNFYGDNDERPPLYKVLANLYALTGSEPCAKELIEAADYVEQICGPNAALTAMSAWVC